MSSSSIPSLKSTIKSNLLDSDVMFFLAGKASFKLNADEDHIGKLFGEAVPMIRNFIITYINVYFESCEPLEH